jgi:hypothetical protein
MSAMGKLIGVECAECRRQGHHCQAQIFVEDEPLCMRCADGEACCYVTGAGFRDGFSFAGADEDDSCQPVLPAQPVVYQKREVYIRPPNYTQTEREQFRRELLWAPVAAVAKRHSLEPEMLSEFVDEKGNPKPLPKWQAKKLKAAIRRPLRRFIDGEEVRMAPGAVMGPEMLQYGPNAVAVRRVQKIVAESNGITVEEMTKADRSWRFLFERQCAIYLVHTLELCGLREMSRYFNRDRASLTNSLTSFERKMRGCEPLKNKFEECKSLIVKDLGIDLQRFPPL